MSNVKSARPAFQSVELDPIDARLEAKAAERGIPTMVDPKPQEPTIPVPQSAARRVQAVRTSRTGQGSQATPRARMRGLRIELPEYVWVALKKQAADEMVSLRHVIMTALRKQGVEIKEADMVEDGRRLR